MNVGDDAKVGKNKSEIFKSLGTLFKVFEGYHEVFNLFISC